jgi:hypothetical protein
MKVEQFDGFEVEPRWKEIVIYWEGDRGYAFPAGWGVEPPVLYVPNETAWTRSMPDWLRERRSEVIARLAAVSRHRLEIDQRDEIREDNTVTRGPASAG